MHDRIAPNYDILVHCMHCGLCLPHCPTYAITGNERSSPRGRIRLMKAVSDGDLEISEQFMEEMDFCLDCQACETACPAGVRYGALVESARAEIHESGKEGRLRRSFKKFFLGWMLARRSRVHALARLARVAERSGIPSALRESGLLSVFSTKLDSLLRLMPPVSPVPSSTVYDARVLPAHGERRFRVGFLTGCIMDVSYADINEDTMEVLRHHGCEVVIPAGQECCGSLNAHNGDVQGARRLMQTNVGVFDDPSLDFIIMNSAGCGAFMKEYGHWCGDDPDLRERARRVSGKIRDLTEFLSETGFKPAPGGSPALQGRTVAYHDACHLVHTQKISQQPREVIRAVPGIEYRELPEASWCCGSAGIYNILRHEDSLKFLDRKIGNLRPLNADIVVMGNPGCMIQIGFGLAQAGLRTRVLHTATFLRLACEGKN